MTQNIVLKKNPKIEFQILDKGFWLIDEQTEQNSGFYTFDDFESIELNKPWYPSLSKYLRAITWVLNMGVPYFPDADTYKKANLIIRFKGTKLGIWLSDSQMADRAKAIKAIINEKI